MSYSGAQVYLPRGHSSAAVARWLAERLPEAKVQRSRGGLVVRLLGGELELAIDSAAHVREEAQELAERAPAGAAALLRRATRRIEIMPRDPRTEIDGVYNALLWVFEALRAMPEVVGLDPFDGAFYFAAAPASGPEVVIAYRVDDLPEGLARDLPADAGPRGCLFFVHAADSAGIDALMAALPEPQIDHVDEGMALAELVATLGTRGGRLARLLPPVDEEATYGLGFHAGPAEVAEQFLRAAGHDLRPVAEILGGLAILEVRAADDSLHRRVVERVVRDGRLQLRVLDTAGRGLFTVEAPREPAQRWALLDADRHEMIEREPPPAGVVTDVRLRPVARRRAARGRSSLERLAREHALALPEADTDAVVLRVLPDALLTADAWHGAGEDITRLGRGDCDPGWLRAIAGAWVESMLRLGPAAAKHVELYAAIDRWLAAQIGPDAMREATEGALERVDC